MIYVFIFFNNFVFDFLYIWEIGVEKVLDVGYGVNQQGLKFFYVKGKRNCGNFNVFFFILNEKV